MTIEERKREMALFVYRYLKAAALTKEGMSDQECLAFEFEHANDCWYTESFSLRITL